MLGEGHDVDPVPCHSGWGRRQEVSGGVVAALVEALQEELEVCGTAWSFFSYEIRCLLGDGAGTA